MVCADKKKCSLLSCAFWPVLLALIPVYLTLSAGDPLSFILPNALLFTSRREEVRSLWNKLVVIDEAVKFDHPHVPTIDAENYSFESLRRATNGFRNPAVVKGLFKDSAAYNKWSTEDYLPSRIGKYELPVIRNAVVGKVQSDRVMMTFEESFTDIVKNEDSKLYLFFPVKSRFFTNGSAAASMDALVEDVNKVVYDDLELDRIRPGFAGPNHKNYFGSQIIVGQGQDDDDATTGTGWHCAAGNNYFIQVVGGKRWYFLEPKYSAYMYPLRGGLVNMMTGNRNMGHLQNFLPIQYADLEAGDMLYNPDWSWHTIRNKKGLSIGVPIREVNFTLTLQNNFQYTAIVTINKVLEKFGIDIGGYPQ